MRKTSFVLAFLIAAVLAGLFLRFGQRESFMQQDIGKPLDSTGMGPYDEVSLGGTVTGWQKHEEMPVSDMPVGQAMDQNKLMFLVGNKTSTQCCPSAFSTDTGCVCLSGQDQDLMARRGGNK